VAPLYSLIPDLKYRKAPSLTEQNYLSKTQHQNLSFQSHLNYSRAAMSLGKVWNSLTAASIENSLSLVQVNFDFTIQKTVAPLEYRPVGQALSDNRRLNAENGTAHRTARKLGWLFGQLIPNTPELLKAYGRRVCEILQKPGINPIGSESDGPFREYVGADCTSLWAAATSGIPALGVHLLACMLARAWDAQTATAIWVELVESRRAEILSELGQHHNVSVESAAAARQDFPRRELEEWDTSARAWLGQADKALEAQRDQYLLIVKNVSLSTGSNKSPYPNVIAAWLQAMTSLERHLEGTSQQVSDGSVLYAISAWHLYPDLVYFGDGATKIEFSDSLFTKRATMTLGLTEVVATQQSRGTHWSLALSHLRFYGDPVPVESVEDRTRVTISQFQVIILGAVLESWGVSLRDRRDAIQWIHDLWRYLQKTVPFEAGEMLLSRHTSWLSGLAEASQLVLSSTGSMLERNEDYLSHGERWGRDFLLDTDNHSPFIRPYFGLCNPLVMAALEEPLDVDAGIEYLRQVAKHMGLNDRQAIVCYSEHPRGISNGGYFEYCTAVPHSNPRLGSRHARWIKLRSQGETNSRLGMSTACQHECHRISGSKQQAAEVDLDHRLSMIQARGEHCFILDGPSLHTRVVLLPREPQKPQRKASYLIWEHSAALFRDNWAEFHSQSPNDLETSCSCFTPQHHIPLDDIQGESRPTNATFVKYIGTRFGTGARDNFELYVRNGADVPSQRAIYDSKLLAATSLVTRPSLASQWLQSSRPQPTRLWDYVDSMTNPMTEITPQLVMREHPSTPDGLDWAFTHGRAADLMRDIMPPPPRQWIRSLELVSVATEIYKGLPGATISLRVLEYPLQDAFWTALDSISTLEMPRSHHTRGLLRGAGELLKVMGREETLSCIALMETGVSNIQAESLREVMAMSSSNSIFVSASLLSDPHDVVSANKVHHITGNVGYAGLNLMVSPAGELFIRRPLNEVQSLPNRSMFNTKRENNFTGSSLHLSFTGQRFPLVTTDIDTIDQGIFYLQSVVSLWDKGKHIADLNMLGIEREQVIRIRLDCPCASPRLQPEDEDVRSLDSWQDMLLPPRRTAVMRAHGNWSARLAAVALLLQQHKGYCFGVLSSETLCWRCLKSQFTDPEPHIPQILID
jgi:hypothetical protein